MIQVSSLLNTLNSQISYFYSGPLDTEITAIQKVHMDDALLPNVLYISHDRKLVAAVSNTCLLIVPKHHIPSVLSQLQKLVFEDYQKNCLLVQLSVQLTENCDLGEIIDTISRIMGNPTYFLRKDYRLCGSNGSYQHSVMQSIHRNLSDRTISFTNGYALLEKDTDSSCQQLLAPIYHRDEQIGYLYTAAQKHLFREAIDAAYFVKISRMLSVLPALEESRNPDDPDQRFISELIEGCDTDMELIHQKMLHAGLTKKQFYYLFSIDTGENLLPESVLSELRGYLNVPVYRYQHYYVSLIGMDQPRRFERNDAPELFDFLHRHQMYAGLSYCYTDLAGTSLAFEQSILAVTLRKRLTSKLYLSLYEDTVTLHMLYILEQNGIDPLTLCHPVVAEVQKYDKENGTSYMQTLVALVCLNLGLQETADALYIHRNTLYKHINVLTERFHIDLNNHRVQKNLVRTMEIYSFEGKLDVQKLLGITD